jgi:hypothetical protein
VKRIASYRLEPGEVNALALPVGCEVLAVVADGYKPILVVAQTDGEVVRDRYFAVVRPGEEVPDRGYYAVTGDPKVVYVGAVAASVMDWLPGTLYTVWELLP